MSMAAPSNKLPTKTFIYKAVNVQLLDLLRDFAGAQAVPLMVADGVSGVVNANFQLTPEAFLDTVSKAFGLIWYFDGVALYIYPSSQIQTRLLSLKDMNVESVEAKLAAFGLGDRRYPLRFQRGVGLALAFGPPRHIELVEAIINALAEIQTQTVVEEVRAFALIYASAVDRRVQGAVQPGIATTLASVYQDKAPAGPVNAAAAALSDNSQRLNRLEGTDQQRASRDSALQSAAQSLASGGSKPMPRNAPATNNVFAIPAAAPAATAPPPSKVVFSADEATNTVIVRATSEMMKDIEKLIARLDAPSEMIEIEATIIDISSDEVESLGFDWRYQSNTRDVQISPTAGNSSANPTGGGFNITTLFRGNAWELLARIRALESRGAARVVAQPKVLGAANRTAVLSDKRTASVRVAGNQDAQLFSVEAGTTLQVTPRLILDPAQTRIGMELLIEDGGFLEQAVDQVPIVQRTTIRTDAMLNEGQSLLVGGIVVESSRRSRSGLPWLSNLPVIGAAFRIDDSAASKRQRLFLLTPKRVSLAQRDLAPEAQPNGSQPDKGNSPANTPRGEVVERDFTPER